MTYMELTLSLSESCSSQNRSHWWRKATAADAPCLNRTVSLCPKTRGGCPFKPLKLDFSEHRKWGLHRGTRCFKPLTFSKTINLFLRILTTDALKNYWKFQKDSQSSANSLHLQKGKLPTWFSCKSPTPHVHKNLVFIQDRSIWPNLTLTVI